MDTDAVTATGLTVRRGGQDVLTGLDLSVPAGEVVGLLGAGGSGKTTLMRAITGVRRVTAGTVTVLGHPAGAAPPRTLIGYAAQTPSVHADLTVRENLSYFTSVLRAPRTDPDRVMAEAGLGDPARRPAGELSGGRHTRVGLAVARPGSPRLLVLDEPTVGLDPVLREEPWSLFHRLRDRGTTLLVSSHVMEEAGRCDRPVLLREGRLVTEETPARLRERTGVQDLEQAFPRIVREPGPGRSRHERPPPGRHERTAPRTHGPPVSGADERPATGVHESPATGGP
ncbi:MULTISPECIES: ABC transporter ATP-binding protein [unclassified Nocardiopsis]|uniref:ABC transporter ATP-binding protein n=1 Tax=Nocardiopsis TaxID=2013 RepID=UPI00387B986E